jgi:hypothetical protein
MNGLSKKNQETEAFVDEYISVNGYPPTYKEIEKHFNLSVCAAYYRCAKFRYKMRHVKSGSLKKLILCKCEHTVPENFAVFNGEEYTCMPCCVNFLAGELATAKAEIKVLNKLIRT